MADHCCRNRAASQCRHRTLGCREVAGEAATDLGCQIDGAQVLNSQNTRINTWLDVGYILKLADGAK